MAYSSKIYTGDGVKTDFAVPFDYLDRSHVKVRVNKVATDAIGSGYKFSWINATSIRVNTVVTSNPVPEPFEIELVRQTPIGSLAVVFGGGASLSSTNLNKNSDYLTFALQEATDANDAFLKLYLGAKDTFPTLDNGGDPLKVGAVLFLTTDNTPYYWTGSEWLVNESVSQAIDAQLACGVAQLACAASQSAAALSEANAAASECQRRNKNRPVGGVKEGHLAPGYFVSRDDGSLFRWN